MFGVSSKVFVIFVFGSRFCFEFIKRRRVVGLMNWVFFSLCLVRFIRISCRCEGEVGGFGISRFGIIRVNSSSKCVVNRSEG